ncbi:AAA family ATPase [Candidatus Viadribacter manganicus]|uniref:ATPase AAA-type core domain-containing protein n=1 Tax=Candidatus Viadribacter manganicus TaxID=1759059 RepID=A0A1B1AHM9_9PROT|nr:AAA family ATPase [Candidatus Viadribacter manganicus]ANP46058.1 hypothetical protein ATE48_09055 [Candidatus Viadribacter manganicus]
MQNYIDFVSLNILNGILSGKMEFLPGLNLIGGENGTLKTKVLQQLKSGGPVAKDPSKALRIQAFSPKRNSERRAANQIVQTFRQQNRTFDTLMGERLAANINDASFDNYPSLGELYYLVFDQRCRDGTDRRAHMGAVTSEFNKVIQTIFAEYELVADWDDKAGSPLIRMRKHGTIEFPIEALSLGEQEILSLVTCIHSGRDNFDVFLIDEPEVHLNWHLEEKLFGFLDDICATDGKQVIVVTHSRAMFTRRYLPKAQFLFWEGSKVKWGKELSTDQRRRIAGEAIEIIRLGEFAKTTFFVEDASHERFVNALAAHFGGKVATSLCGNSSNVKSLYKLSLAEDGWSNAYFLIDGDNEGNPFPGADRFIHLPVYCADNILIDPEPLAAEYGKDVHEVRQIILDAILEKRGEILKKNKFLDFLLDEWKPAQISYERVSRLDGSAIIKRIAIALGDNEVGLTAKMIGRLASSGQLESRLPKNLVDALKLPSSKSETTTAA